MLALLSTFFAAVAILPAFAENNIVSPDGYERSAVTAGGTFPGTPILINKGDDVDISVHNELTDPTMRRSTSIHWHGFFQARSSYADGPAFVNQCPIPPNTTFHYNFSTAGQTGSYWYHSHLSTQYCDGLRGVFIVYDPEDPHKHLYDYDDESTIITLADWYHDPAPEDTNEFIRTATVPNPDSGLINGRGRFDGGDEVPYAIVNVEYGKRYRLRLVSISCRPLYNFSIDGHNFTAIELDGVSHDPVAAQSVDVYAAQRVSVILEANQTIGNYWIRAPPQPGTPAVKNLTRAILRYAGAPDEEPTTTRQDPPGHALNDAEMHPIAAEGPGKLGNGTADRTYIFNITQPFAGANQTVDVDKAAFFQINGTSYVSPPVPVLLQILSGASDARDFLPSEQVFLIEPNEIVDIVIPGGGAHPFHLHGHNFDIIQTSTQDHPNFYNPPRRDVVPINGGRTTFRFKADNPGAWFLHCHIDWHLEAGLAVVFAESPAENRDGPQKQATPADWQQLCPAYDDLDPDLQ
ncbi:laccase 3 [Dendrothele bispora CBS 962.96]|uniref:Laccase 3 n=1 Tax=Dendrothele bispora (strain CBS 962.96) TaxID=1314807 RepID=A0A4S8LKU3_DENBC|nr:laccase 3 [Dendrothele bispora CBS 962.96]